MRDKLINNHKTLDIAFFSLLNQQKEISLQTISAFPEFFPYLEMNGIAGVFFYCLKKSEGQYLVPPDIFAELNSRFNFQIGRNMARAAEAKIVFRYLQTGNIPFIVLKGIALAEHIYPHFAMRSSSDLDILIHKEDLLDTDQVLAQAGYHAKDSTPQLALLNPQGYLASLEYHKPGSVFTYVHLHWHLVNTSIPATSFISSIDMQRIWENSKYATVAGTEVRILSPVHLIIYLCEHALRVGHSFDRLILVCDIIYAVKRDAKHLDWNIVASEAKSLGLLNFLYLGLKIVQSYHGQEFLSDDIVNRLAPPYLSSMERLFLYLQEKHYRIRGSSYLVYLTMSNSPLRKAYLILRTVFPPRTILSQQQHFRLNKRSKILYFYRIQEILLHIDKMLKIIIR
jgi:hypothetical protein